MPFHLIASRFWAACALQGKYFDKVLSLKNMQTFLLFCIPWWYFVISLYRPAVIQLLRINFSLHLARFRYCHHRSLRLPSDYDFIHLSCAFCVWSD